VKKTSLNIVIDMADVLSACHIMQSQVPAMMSGIFQQVSDGVVVNWREEAHRGLGSTRAAYLRGLQEPEISENQAVIALIGTLPNMLEQGASPFDLKVGFKQSPKVGKKKGGGWFLTIPFRWSTPGAIGENEVFSGKMPEEVFNVAKDLSEVITQPEKGKLTFAEALQESELPPSLQGVRYGRAEIRTEGNVYGAYQHKTNIYSGIIKESKTYAQVTQGQYVSFRRVSDKSDALSWMHKGLMAREFAEKAVANTNVEVLVANAVDKFLGS
jgi:hypothetical protein